MALDDEDAAVPSATCLLGFLPLPGCMSAAWETPNRLSLGINQHLIYSM